MKINKEYLKKETLEQIQEFFSFEAFIQLNSFLSTDLSTITKKIKTLDPKIIYSPLQYRYKNYDLALAYNEPDLIAFYEFFKSKEFLDFLESITQFPLRIKQVQCNCYNHKDFTLLSDLNKEEDYIDVIFDMTPHWHESYGGVLTYTTKESEEFYLHPSFNALTILYKPEEVMKYLKYINCLSKEKDILRIEAKFEILDEDLSET